MKRKITYGLIAVFILLDLFIIYHFVDNYQEKKTTVKHIETLPAFSLESTESVVFTEKGLHAQSWKVFVFFNSECHYCQSEATQLKELQSTIEGIEFIWISSEEKESLLAFQNEYGLDDFVFLQDPYDRLALEWGISTTPQFLIYTPMGALFKNHKGAYRIDKLISQIQDAKTP